MYWAVPVLMSPSQSSLQGQQMSPLVWGASSLSRISQNSPAGSSGPINIYAARNETSSFQVGIQAPTGGLTNVNVTTNGLIGPSGASISGANIALFREQYIFVPQAPPYYWTGSSDGTNPPGGAGWYPDGLIPFVDPETGSAARREGLRAVPFDLPASQDQPIWVDVSVPAYAAPGAYSGTFRISSDQGEASIQVILHVWSFTLPIVPSFKSAYHADPAHQDMYLAHELLRNRTTPDWVDPKDERTLIDQWGLTSARVWLSTGLDVGNCSNSFISPPPALAKLNAWAAQHQTDTLIYDFSADEIGRCPSTFPAIRDWAAQLHAAGIKNMVSVEPSPALEDDGTGSGRSAVDIWTVLPKQYDGARQEIQKVLAKGDSVWSYNVLVQDGYSPKLQINFTPLDYRLTMGFISQSLGITGFQQWAVDQWSSNPWTQMVISSTGVPSDGLLVYPGGPVGIVGYAPSMRLKWVREGTNDFEYVQILKAMGQGGWALQQTATVAPDWRNWTRDYTQVENVRIALGNKIDQLSTTASIVKGPPAN